jgi:hypothetical protein
MSDERHMQNEFTQSPLDNREVNEKALLQLAESFDPGEARRSVLYQYKRGVILLRAKHATYDKIVTMLEKVGVKTSLFSVSRCWRQTWRSRWRRSADSGSPIDRRVLLHQPTSSYPPPAETNFSPKGIS